MAKRVIEELIDDLDGSPADATVPFAFEGKNYEIDLSGGNRKTFAKAMKDYIDHGRIVKGNGKSATPTRPKRSRDDLAEIRAWARETGYPCSKQGRIPVATVEAYDAAH